MTEYRLLLNPAIIPKQDASISIHGPWPQLISVPASGNMRCQINRVNPSQILPDSDSKLGVFEGVPANNLTWKTVATKSITQPIKSKTIVTKPVF